MKIAILLFFFLFFFFACGEHSSSSNYKPPSPKFNIPEELKGEHGLRKMKIFDERSSRLSKEFFLSHDPSGRREEKNIVTFSWETKNGEYAYSSIPILSGKIRLKTVGEFGRPTVIFNLKENCLCSKEKIEDILKNCLDYVVIKVNEKDWPVDIKVN